MSARDSDGPPRAGEGRSALVERLADDILDEVLPDYEELLSPRRFAEMRARMREDMLTRPESRARLERIAGRMN